MKVKKNIKVSIITVVKNGLPFLDDCINSFKLQDYNNKELIVVFSKSNDSTLSYLKEKKIRFFEENKFGIYRAINKGLNKAKGDLVGILHSDDIFFDTSVISDVVKKYKSKKFDICYGNVCISKKNNLKVILRKWQSSKFDYKKFYYGWMPPHTSIFINRNLVKRKYSTKYKISSDYKYILDNFKKNSKKIFFFNRFITIMRSGGLSNLNLKSYILKSNEDHLILKEKFLYPRLIYFLKIFTKISQFIFIKIKFNTKDKIYKEIINKKIYNY
jgi:glycosyltransferase